MAIEQLQASGYELVDINIGNELWREAFLRPSNAHGTLIQIAQSKHSDDDAKEYLRPSNLDELLG